MESVQSECIAEEQGRWIIRYVCGPCWDRHPLTVSLKKLARMGWCYLGEAPRCRGHKHRACGCFVPNCSAGRLHCISFECEIYRAAPAQFNGQQPRDFLVN